MRIHKTRLFALAIAAAFVAPISQLRAQATDIVETVQAAGNYQTFLKLLGEAGLTETLKGPGPFTLFAPTDEAFSKVSADKMSALTKDRAALRKAMLYHIIAGKISSADIARLNGKGTRTMEMSEAKVSVNAETIMINNARISQADIAARNGVIHAIDAVIMPPAK